MQDKNIWNWIAKTLFSLPGHSNFSADNAVVYTLDKSNKYFPTHQENSVSIQMQAFSLLIYVIIWILVFIIHNHATNTPLLIGFSVGLIINLIESFYYSSITDLQVMIEPHDPYILNTPQIENIKVGTKIQNYNNYISYSEGVGDYKILIDNKTLPKKNQSEIGYILPAKSFMNKSAKGDITSINLENLLINKGKYLKHKIYGWESNQNIKDYYSTNTANITEVSYYVSIIVVTWLVYITRSKWGSVQQIYWNIFAFLIAIISLSYGDYARNVVAYNFVIFIRTRILILSISLAIAALFIIET